MSWKHGFFNSYGPARGESGFWPTVLPIGGELTLQVRKIAASDGTIARWWSARIVRRKITVSRMSSRWLHAHRAEHVKHWTDV
jgi:hypothetical protein